MSEINIKSYILRDFIKNNNINNLIVDSCIEDNDNYELKLIVNDNYLKVLTNFTNYCYIDSTTCKTDILNQYILFFNKYKSLEDIIYSIINFNFYENKENTKYTDRFNFYNEFEEKTKLKLNFKELEIFTKNNKIQKNLLNIEISKELLLNNNQIYQLITSEIKKINSNYEYKHTIEPINNSIFSLLIKLYFQNDITLSIKIELDNKLYPFYPPEIEIISPKVKLPLYFAILNLNITKINIWNSSLSLEWIIVNLEKKLKPIIDDYIDNSCSLNDLEHLLLKLANITKQDFPDKLSIDFDILNIPNKNSNNNTWKLGTGYGNNNDIYNWNINNYIKGKQITQEKICQILKEINNLLNEDNFIFIKDSYLLAYIINITHDVNLLEIENENLIFNDIIKILLRIRSFNNFKDIINQSFINNIAKNLQYVNDEIMLLFKNNEDMQNNELYQGLHNIYENYYESIDEPLIDEIKELYKTDNELYCNLMKPLQFEMIEMQNKILITPEPLSIKRVISEISSFKTSLPLNIDSSIWIRMSKTNMHIFTFLISGPKDTPYEDGLYLFSASLPNNYPQIEPKILFETTGNKTVRFNPNLYNCGKVCLSLLGTWSGQTSEKWNPNTSTILQVLISIQSLILIDKPYFNEPSYETLMNTPKGENNSKLYNNEIQYNNIKWAMIDQIKNPPKGYEEVVKNHFKFKKNNITNIINKWIFESSNKYKSNIENESAKLFELLNNL